VSPNSFSSVPASVYYLPGSGGWEGEFSGRPTALWKPQIETSHSVPGVEPNGFGFRITWANGKTVLVEASPSLTAPTWSAISTNTLTDGWSDFRDPDWANHPSRFYRLRAQ
jgi:hypothetical protein